MSDQEFKLWKMPKLVELPLDETAGGGVAAQEGDVKGQTS